MTNVFIPHVSTRYDKASQSRVPSVDLNPASKFGNLVLMTETGSPVNNLTLNEMCDQIRASIDAHFSDGDYIVAVGNPILISAAIVAANAYEEVVTVLVWDGVKKEYDRLEVHRGY